MHHLLSNLEFDCFLLLDWAEPIVDIREQYPLFPLEETLAIADELGIRHPTYVGTVDPSPCTTDFLITIKQANGTKEEAMSAKYVKDLGDKRVLEKLELERRYWEKRQTPWHIATERDVPKTMVENLKWLLPFHSLQSLSPLTEEKVARIRAALEHYRSGTETLTEITEKVDDRPGLIPGTSLSVSRHLFASRLWRTDLSRPLLEGGPLHLLEER